MNKFVHNSEPITNKRAEHKKYQDRTQETQGLDTSDISAELKQHVSLHFKIHQFLRKNVGGLTQTFYAPWKGYFGNN